MKRCPQCEFIYEDDQSLCDMDGILLVFDSQQLPQLRTSSTTSLTKRRPLRGRIIPTTAVLVLGTVLSLVYYVSTHRQPASVAIETPAATSSQVVPSVPPGDNPKPPATEVVKTENSSVVPAPSPEAKPETKLTTPPESKPSSPAPKSKTKGTQKVQQTSQENDSKIGSLFKKTGRILKKPFKL